MKKPKKPKPLKEDRTEEQALQKTQPKDMTPNLPHDYEDFVIDDEEPQTAVHPRKKDKKDYDVGRGRPPKHTQFKKGASGNPGGRPKGSKNMRTLIYELAEEMVSLRTQEGVIKMPMREAAARKFLSMMMTGNLRYFKEFWDIEEQEQAKLLSAGEQARLEQFQILQYMVDELTTSSIKILSKEK